MFILAFEKPVASEALSLLDFVFAGMFFCFGPLASIAHRERIENFAVKAFTWKHQFEVARAFNEDVRCCHAFSFMIFANTGH